MAPRFDAKLNSSIIAVRRPLGEVNRENKGFPGTENPGDNSIRFCFSSENLLPFETI